MADHTLVLRAIIEAWRHQDVEGVLKHVHEDITWNNSGGYRAPIQGKAAMRAALQGMAGKIKSSKWRLFAVAQVGNSVWMEGVDELVNADGVRIAIPYAGVLEFDGAVVKMWREYFDGRIQENQLQARVVTPEVEAMLKRPAV